ncbi:hypothetical protein [Streptosporangium pseudovulgare]|uniref:Uncharacterized protein n=1 Tax=Streptosporangium pseudovulgare TaxID=35765 RepID=A0ABQ2QVC8_9ACTN|nr:hypothetical protein [Streptosporangium pseudovulgare]GGP97267.1 hypothetical protein GCM10010140_29090 [Streptosporangium pseudovulgare]
MEVLEPEEWRARAAAYERRVEAWMALMGRRGSSVEWIVRLPARHTDLRMRNSETQKDRVLKTNKADKGGETNDHSARFHLGFPLTCS